MRTLWSTGRLELLRREAERYKCDILGLAEVRWTGSGELNGGEVLWSGEEEKHEKGVGFLLSKRAKRSLLGYNPVSPRIIVARFSGHPFNLACVQVYAPTTDSTDAQMDDFYGQLETIFNSLPRKDVKIVMGDWNAKIGVDNTGWQQVMGRYGYGNRNERGEELLEFATKLDLYVCNTRFQQKDCRKWTWLSPGERVKNMIDLILIDKRWKTAVRNCRSCQGADVDSDHSLVLSTVQLRLKRSSPRSTKEPRLDIEALRDENIRTSFEKEVITQLTAVQTANDLDEEAATVSKAMREAAKNTLPKKREAKKPWITERTLNLVDEKRLAKLRRQDSEKHAETYKKVCNAVKMSVRQDKEQWLKDRCTEIEKCTESNKSKSAYKLIRETRKKWQGRQSAIRDKNGVMLQSKEEISQRWTEYCSELYKENGDYRDVVNELNSIAPPPREDIDETILYSEVEAAVRKLKANKSPGPDGIASEMLVAGGECVLKELHHLCNRAWLEGRIPEEWTRSTLVMIPKKGDLSLCTNYRTIALMSHVCKVLMMILLERLKVQVEPYLSETQAGFRRDRNTIQQILILRLIAEKAKRKSMNIYNNFVDFQKAFDSISHDVTWSVLKSYGVGQNLVTLMKNICERSKMAVRVGSETGEWFRAEVGTKQGDPISPTTFITYLERIMDKLDGEPSVSVHGQPIDNLRFADDIDLIESSINDLQIKTDQLNEAAKLAGLKINVEKTKVMVFGEEDSGEKVVIEGMTLESVNHFEYLGSLLTWDNNCSKDVDRRIAKASGVMAELRDIWKSKEISIRTKKRIIDSCVFSVFLYASETWTLKKRDRDRILALESRCYRRALGIRWPQKVKNSDIHNRMGVKENLLQKVLRRKLTLFGHVCRMDDERLVKSVMFGIMDGTSRVGRPCREWLDDVIEWCEGDIQQIRLWASDRTRWSKLVEKALATYGR